ncbi:rod shape-determining protein [Paenibacillus sp. GD4]|uniref:rod shape-determining protein n=1 Tax=Paenibacillus sp. GD4 TaxID=3068890 RepID=UPI0027964FE4|nr:rod shape-determining protein [Paenibacillus sp. GD4]MDQ1912813.1 rod shape-determining protein [Paenibacillus sp. GD4]
MLKRWETIYGIDLGTCNTVIYERDKGIVLHEPSVVAYRQDTQEILAVGASAQAMIGRAPNHVEIAYPLMNGVIANFDLASSMLKHFVQKLQGRGLFRRSSKVYISVPCGITNVQRRAVEETLMQKGMHKPVAVEEPLAAALGAQLPIDEPVGHLVVDIGGGTSQVAIISLGGIVASHTIPRAGMSIDRDIMDYVKRKYNMQIGERTAETIKMQVGSATLSSEERSIEIRGRDLVAGLPRSLRISSKEIFSVIDDYLASLVEAIRATLDQCPPELAGDMVEQGILLCGGGALLEGIDERIRKETGVPVMIAEKPLECTALGTGVLLEAALGMRRSAKAAVKQPVQAAE